MGENRRLGDTMRRSSTFRWKMLVIGAVVVGIVALAYYAFRDPFDDGKLMELTTDQVLDILGEPDYVSYDREFNREFWGYRHWWIPGVAHGVYFDNDRVYSVSASVK